MRFAHQWEDRLKFVVLSVSSIFTSVLNIISLKVEEAGKVALLDRSSAIIIALIIQITIFHEIPDNLSLVGLFLVLAAVFLTGLYKLWQVRKRGGLRG